MKPRKTRSDKGKKRKPGNVDDKKSLGTRIRQGALTAAKYGAGLYVGSKVWNAGAKAGTALTNRALSRVAPKAHPDSIIGKSKAAAVGLGALVAGDQASRGYKALSERARKRREDGRS